MRIPPSQAYAVVSKGVVIFRGSKAPARSAFKKAKASDPGAKWIYDGGSGPPVGAAR